VELTILERWTMSVEEPKQEWFLNWALRSPRGASAHLTAGWHAYRALAGLHPNVHTAMEYFGGLGAQSLMIEELWAPRYHGVYDTSTEAVRHIAAHVPGVFVMEADSYNPVHYDEADIVGLDFGDLTAWKTREGTQHRALLDRVFAGEPKGVVLTDVAARYLHLHRRKYESLLGEGTCVNYPAYLGALAHRLEELYGYWMVGGFYHRWSTVMAFSRTGQPAAFVPTPAAPIGLEVK
jgi:hypothetical protein